ncbi:MAG: SDR family NAD(P)-dependent oxidoreductase [Novosphingobium sp.]
MSDPLGRKDYVAAGPIAVIIGCGGMGMSVARALGKRHPLLVVDIDEGRLAEAERSLLLEGYSIQTRACDITNSSETRALGEALKGGPGVKALLHVAAVAKSIGSWKKLIDIDLVGAQLIADAVGPHMVKGGVAILISSLASYLPPADPRIDMLLDEPMAAGFYDGLAAIHGSEPDMDWAYNYAKLGINRLAERLAVEWAGREVRALSLSPGMIDSPMARAEGETLPAHDGTQERKTRAEKAQENPLRREGSLLEITSVVDFLASDAASFLNGIDVAVDGGHRAFWRRTGITQR